MNFLEEDTVVEQNQPSQTSNEGRQNRMIANLSPRAHNPLIHHPVREQSIAWCNDELLDLEDIQLHSSMLLYASMPLLSLLIALNRLSKPQNIDRFKTAIKQDLYKLRQDLEHYQMPSDMVSKVCFLTVVAIDEAIIHCPWGDEVCWENHMLLGDLFGYCNGGELFFDIVNDVLANSKGNIQLIELIHLFFKLGYRGQYRNQHQAKIDELIEQCENALKPYSGDGQIRCHNIRALKAQKLKHKYYFKPLLLCSFLACIGLTVTMHYHHQQATDNGLKQIEQRLKLQPLEIAANQQQVLQLVSANPVDEKEQ